MVKKKQFGILKRVIKNKNFLILIAIALLGFLLRIYNLPQLFYYSMDEEAMNLIQRNIVLLKHFPMIGSVSPLSTYLGPIFYYFGAFILFLSNLNPLGQGYFGCILGFVNILLIYRVGKDLFNHRVGLFAAAFYSFSFLQIIFDRRYWHLTPGPLLSLLVLYSLYKIKNGSIKFIYLLVSALIFGWNTDYTNLVLFLFVGIMWWLLKLPVRKKEIVVAIAIFLISNAPLVIFDLRHNFLNTKSFVSYFTDKISSSSKSFENKRIYSDRETLGQNRTEQAIQTTILPFVTLSRTLFVASDLNISNQHTYCKGYIVERNSAQGIILPILAVLIIVSFIILAIKAKKTKEELSYKLVLSFYLIFQLGIIFYAFVFKGDVFEHYLATLLPYYFLISAILLSKIYSRFPKIALILLGIFIALNIRATLTAYNPLGFQNKLSATNYALEKIGNKKFSLDTLSSCFRWDGFYYPYVYLGRHPVKSFQDPNYSYLYDYKVPVKQPRYIVVMVPKGKFEDQKFYDFYNRYQKWVIDRKTFGGIEVMILDNSKGDFH